MEIIILVGPPRCGKTRLAWRLQGEFGDLLSNALCFSGNVKLIDVIKDLDKLCKRPPASLLFDDMPKEGMAHFKEIMDDETIKSKVMGVILIPSYIPDYLINLPNVQIWDKNRIHFELYRRGIKI